GVANGAGISLYSSSLNNRIGTDGDGNNDTAERNVVAGNSQVSLDIDSGCNSNIVSGNWFGFNAAGTERIKDSVSNLGTIPAGTHVVIHGGAQNNIIGVVGASPNSAQRNVFEAGGVKITD